MAERRMFAKSVIDSDLFMDMPMSSQALYFHLAMRADDDGFVANPKKIQRMTGCADDDMRILIARQFVLAFDSGIIVIRHWKVHNYIQSDRYKPTVYTDEKKKLTESGGKPYVQLEPAGTNVSIMYPACIQDVSKVDTQDRLGKDRLGKVSIGEDKGGAGGTDAVADAPAATPRKAPAKKTYGEYGNVRLTDDELEKLKDEYPTTWQALIDRLSGYIASKGDKYKSHYATIKNWARKDQEDGRLQRGGPAADGGESDSEKRWAFLNIEMV